VNRVVPDDCLREVTTELCSRIAAGVPAAVQALKAMLVEGRNQTAAEHVLMQFEFMNRYRPDLDSFTRNLSQKPS